MCVEFVVVVIRSELNCLFWCRLLILLIDAYSSFSSSDPVNLIVSLLGPGFLKLRLMILLRSSLLNMLMIK